MFFFRFLTMVRHPAEDLLLYEDNHCLVLNKPAGLLTQGVPAGIPTLEALAKDYLRQRYHKRGGVYLGIPHRLDRPVSGVVVFARNTKAARRLAAQFQQHQVEKIYWAALEGEIAPPAGVWEDWLRKVPEAARAEAAAADAPGAKHARLCYRRLGRCRGGSWVEFRPTTGRMHQLRLQAALHGHPVQGDWLYGARLPFGPPGESPRDRPIALHAHCLTFLHPIRYEPLTVVAPLPVLWSELQLETLPLPRTLPVPEPPENPLPAGRQEPPYPHTCYE
jgi:23S rRNA pseudouridine1911/1915/1917 synthase